jgi:hypothetical protein
MLSQGVDRVFRPGFGAVLSQRNQELMPYLTAPILSKDDTSSCRVISSCQFLARDATARPAARLWASFWLNLFLESLDSTPIPDHSRSSPIVQSLLYPRTIGTLRKEYKEKLSTRGRLVAQLTRTQVPRCKSRRELSAKQAEVRESPGPPTTKTKQRIKEKT